MSRLILGTPEIPHTLLKQDRILNDTVCPDCLYQDDRPAELKYQELGVDPELRIRPSDFNGLRGALIGACSLAIGRGESTSAILSGSFERTGLGEARSIQSLIRQSAAGAFNERKGLTLNLDHTVTSKGKILSIPDDEIPVGNRLAASVAFAELVRDLRAFGVNLFDLSEIRASDGGQIDHIATLLKSITDTAKVGQPLVFPGLEADTPLSNAFTKLLRYFKGSEWAAELSNGYYSPDVSLKSEVADQISLLQEKLPGLKAGTIRIVGVLEAKNRIIANAYNQFAADFLNGNGEDAIIEGTFRDIIEYIPAADLENGIVNEEDVKNFFSKFVNKRGRGDAIIREKTGNIGVFNTTYRELLPVGPEQGLLFREVDYTQPEDSWDLRTRMLLELGKFGQIIPRSVFNRVVGQVAANWEGGQVETFMSSYFDVINSQFAKMKYLTIESDDLLVFISRISRIFEHFEARQAYLVSDPRGQEELATMFGYNQLPFESRRKKENGVDFQLEAYRESLLIIMAKYLSDFRANIARRRGKDD
jgi:hypothetical protein